MTNEMKNIQSQAINEALKGMSEMLSTVANDAVTVAVNKVIAQQKAEIEKTSSLWVKMRNNFYISGLTLVAGTLVTALQLEMDAAITKLVDKLDG
ncbi:hypothetical protein SRRS_51950 [Sporomusa rhizae]|uniref:hypothetical protein n=1 Tax=Sporomusa rhizae TaxID=357999 RepID=UPI003529D95C